MKMRLLVIAILLSAVHGFVHHGNINFFNRHLSEAGQRVQKVLLCSRLRRCPSKTGLSAAYCKRTFQFVPYGSKFHDETRKSICADGLVDGTDLHLSHWTGNKTPKQYLSDLSTECAFKFIETEEDSSIWKDAIIVNNHFDTDGLLSVWALMEPEKAREHKAKMLAAAAAGDFDEWGVSERGLQLNFAFLNIAKSASAEDADAYALLLPQVESLLETIDDREDLWGMDMEEVREADDLWADDIIKSSRVIDDKVNSKKQIAKPCQDHWSWQGLAICFTCHIQRMTAHVGGSLASRMRRASSATSGCAPFCRPFRHLVQHPPSTHSPPMSQVVELPPGRDDVPVRRPRSRCLGGEARAPPRARLCAHTHT
jgi:hypothetical protein